MLRHKNLEVNHKTFCSTLLIPSIHFWHATHWITNSCSCLGQHSIGWSYSATFSLIIISDDPGLNSIMLIKLYNCTWFNLFWNFALLHCIKLYVAFYFVPFLFSFYCCCCHSFIGKSKIDKFLLLEVVHLMVK